MFLEAFHCFEFLQVMGHSGKGEIFVLMAQTAQEVVLIYLIPALLAVCVYFLLNVSIARKTSIAQTNKQIMCPLSISTS